MRFRFLAAALVAAVVSPCALAASPNVPLVTLYDAASLAKACEAGLVSMRKAIDIMAARKGAGDILGEWNRLFILQEDASNVPMLYSTIHPDKDTRAAAEDCEQKFSSLTTELNQNEKIFARLKAFVPANPKQAKLQKDLMQGFEDSGAALPPAKRARAKELLDKIDEIRVAFERNVREDPTKVTFTAAEMEGLPEAYLKARKPDANGNYVLGLEQPSYGPFMANAKSGAARERYYRARNRQGGQQNLDLLDQQFQLRQELAHLYGLPSFAEYVTRRRMAGSAAAVERFLADVKTAVEPAEKAGIAELRADKARELGTDPAATRFDIWDMGYYLERVKRARFDVNQEKLRAYFPSGKSVEFCLLITERLYGLKFKEGDAPVWHPDVRYFEMSDAKSGRYLGNIYLDIFPRDGKRPGAFAAPLRSGSRLAKRTPSAALVANLDRQGLNQRELGTLLHEFGHVLNMVLADVEYAPQAISTVKWDFVEAPSQMFEEWARNEQALGLFREVCADCPRLTSAEIQRMEEARRHGESMAYARQWQLASLDMELSIRPRSSLEVWKKLESESPFGYVEGTMFPAAFGHIASNYAAGYYGYMWSRVIARDLLSAYQGNLLDPKVGARYRATILGAGVENEEAAMVRKFLGREPSSAAFFAEISGKS